MFTMCCLLEQTMRGRRKGCFRVMAQRLPRRMWMVAVMGSWLRYTCSASQLPVPGNKICDGMVVTNGIDDWTRQRLFVRLFVSSFI